MADVFWFMQLTICCKLNFILLRTSLLDANSLVVTLKNAQKFRHNADVIVSNITNTCANIIDTKSCNTNTMKPVQSSTD